MLHTKFQGHWPFDARENADGQTVGQRQTDGQLIIQGLPYPKCYILGSKAIGFLIPEKMLTARQMDNGVPKVACCDI